MDIIFSDVSLLLLFTLGYDTESVGSSRLPSLLPWSGEQLLLQRQVMISPPAPVMISSMTLQHGSQHIHVNYTAMRIPSILCGADALLFSAVLMQPLISLVLHFVEVLLPPLPLQLLLASCAAAWHHVLSMQLQVLLMTLYTLALQLEDPFEAGPGAHPDTLCLLEFNHTLSYVSYVSCLAMHSFSCTWLSNHFW